MNRLWVIGATALLLSLGSVGCVSLDEHQALQRANRVLEQDLSRSKADLQDAQMLVEQQKTTIDGLNKQLATKDEMIASLTGQTQYLQEAFDKAQAILEKKAQQGVGEVVIMGQKLPPQLHEKLKAFAEAHPDLVVYDEKKGAVRWKSDLLFPSGSDALASSGESLESLKEFAAIVNSEAAAGFDVIVVGHTDTDPIKYSADRFQSNWDLSAYRSIAVMKLLTQQQVATKRLGIMGYADQRPIADNSTEAGKAKNRRVEIYLVREEAVQSVS